MSIKFNNFLKIQNIGLFFLLLTPVSFIAGSLIANIFTILLSIIYFSYQSKSETYYFIKKNKFLIILLFVFTCLNIIFSDAKLYSLSKAFPYFRFFIFSISIIFILNAISKNILLYSKGLFILIFFLIIDSYIQLYFGKDIFGFPYIESYGRITGPFGDEMIIGNYLFYFGFLSIALINYFYKINKYYNFLLFLILALTILLTGERAPFVSLLYIYILIFLFSKNKKFILFLSLSVIICSTTIINFSDRLSSKYSISSIPVLSDIEAKTFRTGKSKKQNLTDQNKQESFIYKINLSFKSNQYVGHYSRAIDIFKKNYVLGSGFKSYRKICGQYETMRQANQYDEDKNRRLTCSIHPHNYHLEILSDTGIIGYLIFLSFIIYICFLFFKKKLYKNFSSSILFCLIITYIFPFKPTGSFFSTNSAFIFWFLIAHFFYFINLNGKKTSSLK